MTAIKQSFFIAADHEGKEVFVSSDHVVQLSPVKNGETELRTDGGTEYSHRVHVKAPFETVRKIFADHGYEFITPAAIAAAGKSGPKPAL